MTAAYWGNVTVMLLETQKSVFRSADECQSVSVALRGDWGTKKKSIDLVLNTYLTLMLAQMSMSPKRKTFRSLDLRTCPLSPYTVSISVSQRIKELCSEFSSWRNDRGDTDYTQVLQNRGYQLHGYTLTFEATVWRTRYLKVHRKATQKTGNTAVQPEKVGEIKPNLWNGIEKCRLPQTI